MGAQSPEPAASETNKRNYRRIKLVTQLLCEALGREEIQLTRDISLGGVFVTCQNPMPKDAEVVVAFRLKPTEPLISCRALVAHAQQGMGMGLKFIDLTEECRQALVKFLDEAA